MNKMDLGCKGCVYEEIGNEKMEEVFVQIDNCLDCKRMHLEGTIEHEKYDDKYIRREIKQVF